MSVPASVWPDELLHDDRLARARGHELRLRAHDHTHVTLDVARWHRAVSVEEHALLGRTVGPVLDVGCGPGRLVGALVAAGRHAAGLDTSGAAVRSARTRGAPVLHASVFDPLPAAGSWGTVLLVDGNIGIGGSPADLLARVASLLDWPGRVLLELDGPHASGRRMVVRIEGAGLTSRWFPWAQVSVSDIVLLASSCGFATTEVWAAGDRWFAQLDRPGRGEVTR